MATIEKVKRYEEFLNEKLASDLEQVMEAKETVYNEIAEYQQLRNALERMSQDRLKTLVDIGANFYMHARVQDASRVIVAVGMGLFLEMTRPEALKFINIKLTHLEAQCEELGQQGAEISARMKLVLEGLRELQFLPGDEPKKPLRDVW